MNNRNMFEILQNRNIYRLFLQKRTNTTLMGHVHGSLLRFGVIYCTRQKTLSSFCNETTLQYLMPGKSQHQANFQTVSETLFFSIFISPSCVVVNYRIGLEMECFLFFSQFLNCLSNRFQRKTVSRAFIPYNRLWVVI